MICCCCVGVVWRRVEEERKEIERMFGRGVGDVLRRARERREKEKGIGEFVFF